MNVIYKCVCQNSEQTVTVPDRLPNVDINFWISNIVGNCLAYDHSAKSPNCKAEAMEYLKIPVEENVQIGGKKVIN